MTIREITNTSIISLQPSDTVGRALEIMQKKNIHGAPVVDNDNNLLGIIVKADIYRFLIEPGHFESCPVDWAMTKNVFTAQIDEEIIDVAKRLRDYDVIALPVLENEKVAGIISIEDFMDYFIKEYK